MASLAELQAGIRALGPYDRELLMTWMREIALPELGVAEAAPAYLHDMTVEQFLEFAEGKETRYEYVAGVVYAQSGESFRHNEIVTNLAGALRSHLRGGPCKLFHSGVLLRMQVNHKPVVYCPDVMVLCGPQDPAGRVASNPRLIIEVLSPSTERIDRGEKLNAYQQIPELQEYILVAQSAPRIAVHRRADAWRPAVVDDMEHVIELQSIELSLALRTVYDGLFE
jgi:Uma2 family endonuclease